MLTLARRRLERNGGDLDGIITLTLPSEEERKLIIGLTGLHRPPGVKSVRIPLTALNEAVVAECGMPLIGALEVLHGPVRNRPAERLGRGTGPGRRAGRCPPAGRRACRRPLVRRPGSSS